MPALAALSPYYPLSNATPVTQLRFIAPERDPHDGSRRRLSIKDGWRLEGNLHTLGYFAGECALIGYIHIHMHLCPSPSCSSSSRA